MAASHATGEAATELAGISLGDKVQQSESRRRRDRSRNNRTGSCEDLPESLADDRHAADTVPLTGRG